MYLYKTSNFVLQFDILVTWFEHLSSQKLQILLESFDVKIARYPVSRDLLKGPQLTECVKEVRALARSVVLCKSLKVNNKKPGTVWACAVVVKIVDNQVVISEKVLYILNVLYIFY